MITVFRHTLWESIHRRIALAMLTVAALGVLLHLGFLHFQTQSDGAVLVSGMGYRQPEPAARFVAQHLQFLLVFSDALWLFLGLFAAAPLLTTFLDKGWVELLLSKGVGRSQVFFGRVSGAFCMFLITLLLLDVAPATYLWVRTGVSPWHFLLALAIVLLAFASLLAMMSVVAIPQPSAALLIAVAFLQLIFSRVLAERAGGLYNVITAKWAQFLIDWTYRILPKTYELSHVARTCLRTGHIDSWWPVWSTALFAVAALGLAGWLFHRKSY